MPYDLAHYIPRLQTKIVLATLIFLLTPVSSPSLALVAKDKKFSALIAEADLILVGTVQEMHGRILTDGLIVTDVWLDIREVVKGEHNEDSYPLQMLGGVIDGKHMKVHGAPTFQRGVTYTLFIKGNGTIMFPLVGVAQGQFRVHQDPDTKTEVLVASDGRLVIGIGKNDTVVTEPSLHPQKHHGAPPRTQRRNSKPLSLSQFLNEVKDRLSP